jgi:hypothetical protein
MLQWLPRFTLVALVALVLLAALLGDFWTYGFTW